jgi:hypothetical protein
MLDIHLTRSFIKSALEQYAAFFRAIAAADSSGASLGLQGMESVDQEARLKLKGENWSYYRTRKARLLGLFRKRLMMTLETEAEREIITQAERLVDRIEVSRTQR